MDLERISMGLNSTQNPNNLLPYSEVKATAKSVANGHGKILLMKNFRLYNLTEPKKNTAPKKQKA